MSILDKFAEVELGEEIAALSTADRRVLELCVRAARHLDAIFWQQSWSGAAALRDRLAASSNSADRERLPEVILMAGPYDRLEEHRPFVPGVPPRPLGAAFYPDDVTAEELQAWVREHPADREAFEGLFTVIRRENGGLVAVPFREAYRERLEPAAAALRAAAEAAENPTLARYLRSRADALLSDDYYASDLDWMDVHDNTLDVTIGPYETYEDLLFGYKASYEAYVGVVDARESANLQTYAKYLDDVDAMLASRVPYTVHRGTDSPIRVINLVYNAGEARAGVQTTAFNLPNDERVHQARGTRKVMLRNVARAKFEKSMLPIARTLLSADDLPYVTFDAYFTNVLLHEMAHSLGPSYIQVDGQDTTVRKSLRELYSSLEEAKADIVGLLFHQWLIDRGILPLEEERCAYTSFLAGFFRSIRFGMQEAHGKANVVELNFLTEAGGVRYDRARGLFSLDLLAVREGVEALALELIRLEARGSYDDAKQFLETYGRPDADLMHALARLKDVPVDILPRYRVEAEAAV